MGVAATVAVQRQRLAVRGVVQGVGFRPFVYRLATRYALAGWVLNRSGDVAIEIEGPPAALAAFRAALQTEAPPLARIEALDVADVPPVGADGFAILASRAAPDVAQPVPPDTAPCADCLRELSDPRDRRYGYPFTNCTNCGPRFTIIEALPYDRPNTTMRRFPLCPACAAEYADPADRRYHAQPVACPACGPRLWLEAPGAAADGAALPGDPLAEAVARLRDGAIVALKGLGGFHLACDARDEAAVARLRQRKRRGAKPFAVMFADLAAVRAVCAVDAAEAALLASPRRPIVLVGMRPHPQPLSQGERGKTPGGPNPPSPPSLRRKGGAGGAGGDGAGSPRPLWGERRSQDAESQVGRGGAALAPSVAPGLREVGAMLPSTPLHHLLLAAFGGPLVMTSGNLAEEPIAAENDEARARLAPLADAFLLHDRPIASRYDDSVARVVEGTPVLLRRARSYAPLPLDLPFAARRPVLACGGQLKNTFCLLKDRHAFLSQHLGDLENLETLALYQATVALYERLFAVRPAIIAHDLHPEYLSTKLALGLEGVERVAVQHHHAHIVSCLVEHGLRGPAIGVAFDGLGYGTDGCLWGGEWLVADWRGFARRAHLRAAPMPGGAAAIRKPWRMALGYLAAWFPADLDQFAPFLDVQDPREAAVTRRQVERGLNAPPTTSCGRLFDALAALLGVCSVAQYEAQAAMELQALADPAAGGAYPYELREEEGGWVVDPAPLLWAAYADRRAGVPLPTIAMRCHRAVADFTAAVCARLAAATGRRQVALSGGVFQNTLLLRETLARLRAADLDVRFHRQVPTNDGGLALGQAVVAHAVRGADDDV
ncbi:MAG TPA: carbamoyltransferase HypF [Chloroflexota bacterium]|nr:carbamoyltransferase HypF [Chloroflexota bacterium]